MEAQRKEYCHFDIKYGGEIWHVETAWVNNNGKPCWYEGIRVENCKAYFRIFLPEEVDHMGKVIIFRNEEDEQ